MSEKFFKRLQISGLFVISFLSMMVHMSMHFLSTDNDLFNCAGNYCGGACFWLGTG